MVAETEDLKARLLKHLHELLFFLTYRGANPFKIRAYEKGVDIFEGLDLADLQERIENKTLIELDGIGKGLSAMADAFLKTGTSPDWSEAKGDLPLSLLELADVKGLGAKKIQKLYEELQIKSLGELEYACNENRLIRLAGFGEKTQAKILKEIEHAKKRLGSSLLKDAIAFEEKFRKDAAATLNLDLFLTGEVARRSEVVNRIEYILETKSTPALQKKIETLSKAESGLSIQFHWAASVGDRVFMSIRATSSESHWKSLESAAQKKQIDLASLQKTSAEEFYRALDLSYYPPESREFPATRNLPALIADPSELTGVFHLHTVASDGIHTLEQMAKAARDRGWAYMGLSDHSQSAAYAQGLDEKDLEKQWEEVDRLNARDKNFKVYKGVESDILKDGSLDYSPSTLRAFDFVIASIHSRYGMNEMTARLLKAIENPQTTMIGHISGRLLLARSAYEFDTEKIIDAAIANRKIIELNSHPNRLDMDWRFLRAGCEKGLLISINPDAHSVDGFNDVIYGTWMARKALVPREQIVNTWPRDRVEAFLKEASS